MRNQMTSAKWFGIAALALVGAACNDSSLAPAPLSSDAPIAVIDSAASEYSPLDTAAFDGTQSHDPDGGAITGYAWELSARPAGSTSAVIPLGADGAQADFFVDLAGDYKIKLTVTDEEGETGFTEYAFSAIPAQSLHIQLTWDSYNQTDMDLHLINTTPGVNGTYWDSTKDCYFMNCKVDGFGGLDWGAAGVDQDNPTLDIDNISESVPENINIITPNDGNYEINVHYYSGSVSNTTLTVRVYLGGDLAYEQSRALSSSDQVWRVGTVNWAGGTGNVTEHNTVFTDTNGFFANPK